MKKIILALLLITFLVVPVIGLAADKPTIPTPTLPEVLTAVTNVLFWLLVTVAVIFIILGAFSLLTAQGDDTKIKEGRTKIMYAIIAVVVGIAASGAVTFIRGQLE